MYCSKLNHEKNEEDLHIQNEKIYITITHANNTDDEEISEHYKSLDVLVISSPSINVLCQD